MKWVLASLLEIEMVIQFMEQDLKSTVQECGTIQIGTKVVPANFSHLIQVSFTGSIIASSGIFSRCTKNAIHWLLIIDSL